MRRFINIVSPTGTPKTNFLKSIAAERLDENKRTYASMMASTKAMVDQFGRQYDDAGHREAKAQLERGEAFAVSLRQDRAVWMLREVRLAVLTILANKINSTYPGDTEGWQDFKKRVEAAALKADADYTRQTGQPHQFWGLGGTAHTHITYLIQSIQHFQGTPYAKLQSYVFGMDKSWNEISMDLKEIEDEFISRARGKLTMEEGDQIILELPDNYVWVLLNRAACSKEAKAMGHCGNSPASGTKQRIISLRKVAEVIDNVQYQEPCLTFILHENGYLGEMKGKGNLKPADHYHDQIEALLRLPLIKGIQGGGYLAKNNFSINDLPKERGDALLDHNPNLITAKEAYERYGLDHDITQNALANTLENKGWQQFRALCKSWGMSYADEAKLQTMPRFLSPANEFKANGISERFIKLANSGLLNDATERYDWNTNTVKRPWFNDEKCGTNGVVLEKMTEEQQRAFFKGVPKAMMPADVYRLQGVSDRFVLEALDGIRTAGLTWFKRNKLDPMSFSEEDQNKLFTTDIREAYEKVGEPLPEPANTYADDPLEHCTPENLASFRWWYKKHGVTGLQEKAEFACDHWGNDNTYEYPRYDVEQGLWVVKKFDTVAEFAEAIKEESERRNRSDKSDLEVNVQSDDFDNYDNYSHIDKDDWHCENFDDHISVQLLAGLMKYAQKLKLDNLGYDEDELEAMDEDEREDVLAEAEIDTWEQAWEVICDEDDELQDYIVRAVIAGYESGEAAERYEKTQNYLKNLKPKYGEFRFEYYKGSDGSSIMYDTPVVFGFSNEALCEFFDNHFTDGEDLHPKNAISEHFSHPYHGYSDFDDTGVMDYFVHNDFPETVEDIVDGLDNNNPYSKHVPEKAEAVEKMTPKQLRKAIEGVVEKCKAFDPDFSWHIPEKDEALKDALYKVAERYWG